MVRIARGWGRQAHNLLKKRKGTPMSYDISDVMSLLRQIKSEIDDLRRKLNAIEQEIRRLR